MRKTRDFTKIFEQALTKEQETVNKKLCRIMAVYFRKYPSASDFVNLGGTLPAFERWSNQQIWLNNLCKTCCKDILDEYHISNTQMHSLLVAKRQKDGRLVEIDTVSVEELYRKYKIGRHRLPLYLDREYNGLFIQYKTVFTFQKYLKKNYPNFYKKIISEEKEAVLLRMNPDNFKKKGR